MRSQKSVVQKQRTSIKTEPEKYSLFLVEIRMKAFDEVYFVWKFGTNTVQSKNYIVNANPFRVEEKLEILINENMTSLKNIEKVSILLFRVY